MNTISINEEKYVSPEMELLQITIQSRIMDSSPTSGDETTEPTNPGGNHNW